MRPGGRRSLPLLDMRTWRSDPSAFAAQLRSACHHVGFFQLTHRMDPPVVEAALSAAARFFALPECEKLSIDYARSPAFRGYMAAGVENTAGRPDLREQVEMGAEGAAAHPAAWPPYERLRGPNQWPDAALPALRPAIQEYTRQAGLVASELTEALATALGLPAQAFRPLFGAHPHWQLKIACNTCKSHQIGLKS